MQFLSDAIGDSLINNFRLGNKACKPGIVRYHTVTLELQPDFHTGRNEPDLSIKHISHSYPVANRINRLEGIEMTIDTVNSKSYNEAITTTIANNSAPTTRYMSTDPNVSGKGIRIIVISDTHERESLLGILPACDILIHAGDLLVKTKMLSSQHLQQKYHHFNEWLGQQPATYKIVIAGEEDQLLENMSVEDVYTTLLSNATAYLCNTGIEVMGLYIWGSPLSEPSFHDNPPKYGPFQTPAFVTTCVEAIQELNRNKQIVDILVTHGKAETLIPILQPRLMHVHGHYHVHSGVHINKLPIKKKNDSPPVNEVNSELLVVCGPIMDHNLEPNVPMVVDIVHI